MYKINIENTGGENFKAKSGDHGLTISTQKAEGMGPLDVFLAALGSCVGVYLRRYLDNAKIPAEHFKINIEADLEQNASPKRFTHIAVSVDLCNAKFDERRRDAILEFIKNCPVHNTLKNSPEIAISIK